MQIFKIHTEGTAPYLKGDSNLKPYFEAGKKKNLKLMSITDHFHYIWQNPKYLFYQREFIDTKLNTNSNGDKNTNKRDLPRVLLGAEHTILNNKGKVSIRKKTTGILDMVNLSVHWFGIGIPGFIKGTRLSGDDMKKVGLFFKEKNSKGRDFLKYTTNGYINALKSPKLKDKPKIICHAWNEYFKTGLYLPEILEDAEQIFQVLKEENAAFEFNNKACTNILNSLEQDHNKSLLKRDDYLMSTEEFTLELFKLISKYKLWISISSDAHTLNDIGNFSSSIELIEKFGKKVNFTGVKLVDEEFFKLNT